MLLRADIAQLVERQFCKLRVGGSSPSVGSNLSEVISSSHCSTGYPKMRSACLLTNVKFHFGNASSQTMPSVDSISDSNL